MQMHYNTRTLAYAKVKKWLTYGLSMLLCFVYEQASAQVTDDFRTTGNATFAAATNWETYNGATWIAAASAPTSANGVITISANSSATVTSDVTLDQIVVAGFLQVNAGFTLTLNNDTGDEITLQGAGSIYNRGTINNCGGTLLPANAFETTAWAFSKGTYNTNTATEPTTEATLLYFNQASTTAHIYWTNGNGRRRIVVLKSATAVSANALTDNTAYTADANFVGAGTTVGGGKVIFNGVGNQVNVTGLTNASTYHLAIFEYNDDVTCSGSSRNYKTGSPLLGTFFTGNRPFITEWITDNGQIIIPTTGSGYNYNITWTNLTNGGVGDGSITGRTANHTITGLQNGSTYRISISGTFPRIFFDSGSERSKIRNITQWGSNAWSSMGNAFLGCNNLNANATDVPNLSAVTIMSNMFNGATVFNQNIGTWNTSAVTDMGGMFQQATTFNGNIGSWNTSAVINMRDMFREATDFNQNIGSWNTSGITSMNSMFRQITAFNQNIGSWNTSAVTTMALMFQQATAFNQNIGSWSTSAVTTMVLMFQQAAAFNQNLSAWNVTQLNAGNFNGADRMFANSAMSRANYDNTLIGWASQNVKTGVLLGAIGLKYCAGVSARNTLATSKSWVITGDALLCYNASTERGSMTNLVSASSQNIRTTNNVDISGNSNRTLEAWFKVNTISGTQFIASWGAATDLNAFGLYLNGATLRFYAGGASDYDIGTTVVANTWYYVAVTYNGITVTPYVNGMVQTTSTIALNTTNSALYMGSDVSNTNYLDGSLDEMRIWSVARTQAQIRENMYLTLTGGEAGLVSYYQFNETSGDAKDFITNKDATFFGGGTRSASEVAVAGGTSNIRTVTVGLNTFTNTGVAINFTTAPADEFVAYQLRGNPVNGVGALNLGANTPTCYWIVRQFGAGSVAYDGMNFTLPNSNVISAVDEATPSNLKLYKRADNATTAFPAFFASATTTNNTTKAINFTGFTSQTSFSQFEIGSITSPLPITLVTFGGERREQAGEKTEEVKLTWATASEVSNKGFEIQVSDNAQTFKKIAFVEGRGNSTTVSSYQLAVSNPNDGYYRLKQVDFDGKFSYSPIVFVEGVETLKVYPNPNSGTFTISVGKDKLDLPASLLNAQGVEVWRGTQTEVKANLPAGMYFLHTTVAGKTKITKVIIEN